MQGVDKEGWYNNKGVYSAINYKNPNELELLVRILKKFAFSCPRYWHKTKGTCYYQKIQILKDYVLDNKEHKFEVVKN